MQDDPKDLKARLGKLGLGPEREDEIARELSDHLTDHAEDLEVQGLPRETATRAALDAVADWRELGKAIRSAETEGTMMNYRTRALWLPVLGSLALSNILLAAMQIFGQPPHFYWFYTGKSLGIFCVFIVPWLISQPVVGAVGAYWSRRSGGTRSYQLLAALAPAIALLSVFVVIFPGAMILSQYKTHHMQFRAFSVLVVTWALLPAVPLLLGAAPFLRKPQHQS